MFLGNLLMGLNVSAMPDRRVRRENQPVGLIFNEVLIDLYWFSLLFIDLLGLLWTILVEQVGWFTWVLICTGASRVMY